MSTFKKLLTENASFRGSTSGSYVSVSASASTAAYSLTLPAAQASGTKVLQNDGTGVLSWENASTVTALDHLSDVTTSGTSGNIIQITDTEFKVGTANLASFIPNNSATASLGTSTARWTTVHGASATLYGSTSGNVVLASADTVGTPYTLKLPAADGSANNVMTLSGAGQLQFVSSLSGLTNVTLSGTLSVGTATLTSSGNNLTSNGSTFTLGSAVLTASGANFSTGGTLTVGGTISTSTGDITSTKAGAVLTLDTATVTASGSALTTNGTLAVGGNISTSTGNITSTKAGAILTLDTATVTASGSALTTNGTLAVGGTISTSTGDITSTKAGAVLTLDTATVTASGSALTTNGTLAVGGNISTSTGNITSTKAGAVLTLDTATITASGSALTVGGALTVSGGLTVNGTVTTVSTTNMEVKDSMIILADGNGANTLDIGIIGEFNDGAAKYAGMLWDATAAQWALFTTQEPLATATQYNPNDASVVKSKLMLGILDCTQVTSSGTVSCTDVTATGNLSGVNFTSTGISTVRNVVEEVKAFTATSIDLVPDGGRRNNTVSNASPVSLTLPAAPTLGTTYTICNIGAGDVTVSRGGASDKIDNTTATSLILPGGTDNSRVTLCYIATNQWVIV